MALSSSSLTGAGARKSADRFAKIWLFPILLPAFSEGGLQPLHVGRRLYFDHPEILAASATLADDAFLHAIFFVPNVLCESTGEFPLVDDPGYREVREVSHKLLGPYH